MRITFLGTGTGHQLPDRSTAAIDCDGWGTHFLIDVGSGALRRIREAGINPDTIEAVFITHVHPDHVADLIPLIQMYLLSRAADPHLASFRADGTDASFLGNGTLDVAGRGGKSAV